MVHGQSVKGVSLHSDPRLSLLLKSKKPVQVAAPPVAEKKPKAVSKKEHKEELKIKPISPTLSTTKYTPEPPTKKEIEAERKAIKMAVVEKPVHREKETPDPKLKKNQKTKAPTEDEQNAHKAVQGSSGGGKYAGKGFRVQIYNGQSRDEALRRKADFMRYYPNVKTYLVYLAPYYKLKVGDYKRREDALGMLHEANNNYSPCMIVPDEIAIGK